MEEGRRNGAAVLTKAEEEEEEGGFKYIPEEIVHNILPNLPEDSLLRFRCVSKHWSSRISTGFTKVRKVIFPSNKQLVFRSVEQDAQVEDIKIELDRTFLMHHPGIIPHIYGSCNGFLLIRIGINLFLWNPSTRQSHGTLPYRRFLKYSSHLLIAGLCLDSDNDEYEVVLGLKDSNSLRRSVWVGSFKTKLWSRVDFSSSYNVNHFYSGPTLNNYLHWWSNNEILCFDPKTDNFTEVPIPRDDDEDDIIGVGILDGFLSMVLRVYDYYDENGFKVYRMTRYGAKDSWESMFKAQFSVHPDRYLQLCYSHVIPLFILDEQKHQVLIHLRRMEFEKYAWSSMVYEYGPPEKLSEEYAIVAYDVDENLFTDIAVSKGTTEHYDGPVLYDETVLRLVTPTTTHNSETRVARGGKKVWRVIENKTKSTKHHDIEEEPKLEKRRRKEYKMMKGNEERREEPRKGRVMKKIWKVKENTTKSETEQAKEEEPKSEKLHKEELGTEENKVMQDVEGNWEEPRKRRGRKTTGKKPAAKVVHQNDTMLRMSNAFDFLNESE